MDPPGREAAGMDGIAAPAVTTLVLDTNVMLDAFLFEDPRTAALRAGLDEGCVRWIATAAMRDELERVLGYPNIVAQLLKRGLSAADVLAAFDAGAEIVEAAPDCGIRCEDTDDQPFLDLAAAHGCGLLSRDQALISLGKRPAQRSSTGFVATKFISAGG